MAKIKKQKAKLSECCKSPMIGGVQCENCGSNGKFTPTTAIVRKLEKVVSLLEARKYSVKFEVPENKSNERFIEEDGFIKDTKTRLMWDKNGSQERLTYAKAEEFVAELNKEQYPDWRIPTREELEGILDLTKHDPAIDPIFKCESAGYWSSTPYAPNTYNAWFVYFYDGDVFYDVRNFEYYVRPCRQY
jgi:hypothetical protein